MDLWQLKERETRGPDAKRVLFGRAAAAVAQRLQLWLHVVQAEHLAHARPRPRCRVSSLVISHLYSPRAVGCRVAACQSASSSAANPKYKCLARKLRVRPALPSCLLL